MMPRHFGASEAWDADDLLENEIDAGKLLQGLQQAAGQEPFSDIASEAVQVGRLSNLELVLVVCLDLV